MMTLSFLFATRSVEPWPVHGFCISLGVIFNIQLSYVYEKLYGIGTS